MCSMLTKLRPNERPFILTRSSYMGSGVYANKWTGDTSSSWEMLTYSIPCMFLSSDDLEKCWCFLNLFKFE